MKVCADSKAGTVLSASLAIRRWSHFTNPITLIDRQVWQIISRALVHTFSSECTIRAIIIISILIKSKSTNYYIVNMLRYTSSDILTINLQNGQKFLFTSYVLFTYSVQKSVMFSSSYQNCSCFFHSFILHSLSKDP